VSDLFEVPAAQSRKPSPPEPLAARMRPRTLDEVAGQQHILAPGKLLRRAIESDRFTSLIFYGQPPFPRLRSGHRLFQRPSHKKQIPSSSKFLAVKSTLKTPHL